MTDDPLVSETEVQEIDCVDSPMKKRRRMMMMMMKQKRRKRRRRVGMMQMKEYTRRTQKMKKWKRELQLKWKLKVLMRERRMVRILAMNLIYTLY